MSLRAEPQPSPTLGCSLFGGQGLWTWLPLTTALAARTVVARLPRPVFLRAADALHLICAQEHGLREIYTNDRRMSAAARHFRLKPITVA